MKTCSKCRRDLPLNQFNKKGDGKQPWCKACNRKRSRQYYADNREKHLAVVRKRNVARIRANQDWIIQYLLGHPCCDCNEMDLLVLEFDHLADKTMNICHAIQDYSLARLQQEVAKCEVVCANCHKRRTASRRPTYRSKYLGSVANVGIAADF